MAFRWRDAFRVGSRRLHYSQGGVLLGASAAKLIAAGATGAVLCEAAHGTKTQKLLHLLKDGSFTSKAEPKSKDDLWHEAYLQVRDPHRAVQVLDLVSDVEGWHGLFPFCTRSSVLCDLGDGRKRCQVHFGMKFGPMMVGDVVEYEVQQNEESLHLLSVNCDKLRYVDHLEYTFTARDTDEGGSDVAVTLKVHARKRMYLTIWQGLERQIVDNMIAAVHKRLPTVTNLAE
jgi:ribosome-associated toxin RatA of RatAB toxin-antitoxin module